jgi:hypothetical protein
VGRGQGWGACRCVSGTNAAFAECLSAGCYNDLAYVLAGIAAVALALVITLIVLLWKRKFKAALILVGLCIAAWFIAAFLV